MLQSFLQRDFCQVPLKILNSEWDPVQNFVGFVFGKCVFSDDTIPFRAIIVAMKNPIVDYFSHDVEERILETMPWDKMDKHVQSSPSGII